MIVVDFSGKYVYFIDLGLDWIYQYWLDSVSGKLMLNDLLFIVVLLLGVGLCYFVFMLQGDGLWLINEEVLMLIFYYLDK